MRTNILRETIIALLLAFTANSFGATIKGDMNNDQNINIADVTLLINVILNENTSYDFNTADVNNDGAINVTDVIVLVNWILNGTPIPPENETGEFTDDPAVGPAEAPRFGQPLDNSETP